jgi:hypothetical protein
MNIIQTKHPNLMLNKTQHKRIFKLTTYNMTGFKRKSIKVLC